MRKIIFDNDTKAKIIEHFKNGYNISQLSAIFGNRRVIEKVLIDAGLSLKTKSELIVERIPQLADREYLIELYQNQLMSLLEIANLLKTNEQVVKTAFKRLQIPRRSTVAAKNAATLKQHPALQNVDKIKEDYLNGQSPSQIAKQIGCSSTAIEYLLRQNKIKIRTHSQSMLQFKSTPQQRINSKIARNLRSRFWIALSGKSKMTSAVNDLGISIEEFKAYLNNKFYPHPISNEMMSWDNYGKWEIDHITPLASVNLSNRDEQLKVCHYTNLQPLWVSHNRSKSDMILGEIPQRVPFYLVVGPAGCGKSWVCDQLVGVNYISYDAVPKEQHYHYMVELSKNGKPIVYDPFRKVNTIYNRYASLFDMKIVVINETKEVIMQRLESRGSKAPIDKIALYVDKFKKIKHHNFSGTSQEVLEFLQKELSYVE